ncbi:retrovirus-related pol polyprotein from transposon 17.6 [Plakobranchus ocellatus]|uniref:Retrovirus-related pol polyprotein from transposon 17.6 n=1 Tax=Plakobranchus ocellatus TaxID=259542 RepID=A0AAV3YMG5_9GAST|nr:retrovirus-related pol polyprotein from transposon 17.6 [Plakobranchus ocellatus]
MTRLSLCGNLAFVEDVEDESEESPITFVQPLRKETHENVKVNQDAPVTFRDQAEAVLKEFDDVLSDLPGQTDIIWHEILLTDPIPFRISQYPIPFHAINAVKQEIQQMLDTGIIRPSSSPFASPITVVRKKDGTIRLCIDFRRLNSVTIFDAEPIG